VAKTTTEQARFEMDADEFAEFLANREVRRELMGDSYE
jgi:hypothetical protein